jgi:hypothetical protein
MMLEMDKSGDSNELERLLEAYKIFAEDLARIREQRARTIRSYITINSIILAASAVLIRETEFEIGWEALIIGPLLVAGVIASLQWIASLPEYQPLVNQHIDALKKIEGRSEMESIPKLFTNTDKALKQQNRGRFEHVAKWFYDRAVWLPGIFLALYVLTLGVVSISVGIGLVNSWG